MPTPISERVMAAIAAQLATITTGNGYSITANVLRSVRTVELNDLPAVVLWDTGETATDAGGTHRGMGITLSFEVNAFVRGDQDYTGAQLEAVKADVKQAVLSGSPVGDDDGKIGPVTYISAEMRPREDGDQTESVSLKFSVAYREGYGNPYSTTSR